ncbi:protein SPT2 homolog [Sabethes cyaneus]|uniref:protein SPT2 homolog n=1 Tax=Sabethes cyaneus TaxID=53552 RepID=UPI00237ECC6C|nr:protein SPT2 homolog [Sabethes cyaneus]
MDFALLMKLAQRNVAHTEQKSTSHHYPTKLAVPKKKCKDNKKSDKIKKFLAKKAQEECKDKKLSDNIKKFLTKEEPKESECIPEKKRKRDELPGKSDPKAERKTEKSANKSALKDAVSTQDNARPLQGPHQLPLDDYGHTSNVASQFFQQFVEKYNTTVAAAESRKGTKRNTKEEGQTSKVVNRPAGLDFATVIKLAEKNQFEPIKKGPSEPERLMTEKERREYEEHMAYLEQKKLRDLVRNDPKLSEKEKQIRLAKLKQNKPEVTSTTKSQCVKNQKKLANKSSSSSGSKAISTSSRNDSSSTSSNDDQQPSRPFPSGDMQRKRSSIGGGVRPKTRRPMIRDSDSDYDSEMDDFIDDDVGGEEDYSSHIRAIFGYDRSRYRDEDFDDRRMESTYAQQMREEMISKKLGRKEDLEDMRAEEEEKQQKAAMKKKQKSKGRK